MDKIAVGFFGIHFQESFTHWAGWTCNVDFTKCSENNKQFLFNDNNYTFFTSTYFSSKLDELLNTYSFKKMKLSRLDNSDAKNTFRKRNKIFFDTIKLILEDDDVYDYVLLTRYDLIFRENPMSLVDKNMVNIPCKVKWGENDDLVEDNFYFMPYELLKPFYETFIKMDLSACPHEFHKYYKNFNMMLGEEISYYGTDIPIYGIYRDIISK